MSRISKDIFILLVAFIVLLSNIQITLATVETGFNDIKPTDWFYNDVIEAQRVGLIAGVGNNMFAPNKTISYAEYLTILTRILGADTSNKGNSNHWAAGNIEAAKKLGIISEGEVTNYDAGIPREVMAVFTCKTLGVKPGDGSQIIFEDTRNASPEIRAYINAAYNEYLTEGVGRDDSGKLQFGYGQTVTRAQLATMALRIKDYKEDKEAYKQSRAIARNAAEEEWKKQHNSGGSGGSGSSGSTQQQYITWNGYKFPVGSVFYNMNKDGHDYGLDFAAEVRFIAYPERYDELYNIMASKLDPATVKAAIDYAKTKTDKSQELPLKTFKTPNGYEIQVWSVKFSSTTSFSVFKP
ncbi:S-layer homology domain-containing protein [Tepidanaerobacter syntrophicus]|uniref:S-layer homology domain-containing protein n=1 Tax=Tepidanaerobacter syntrophicus TaxID=224999 RepID=A0A0U9HBH8_9FIRM|nr:S-layer homology domain-containing protein [Tepidanaerobacter syntrophicus]GAQ24133.1 S-layer homology domain-containing protein [Tepidanaerobacter syntrophicus]